ncbi:NosD domain-containing protein [Listeria ivanovii]|uniref:NosD domain-containing protein n=1 Tax=Listeria ivanovii TaxID=1638 RepID=UPI00194087B8|nr:NosD domain-containing protein [Listeria ivanovii]MBM5609139.1 right-handed parallel beta-helix repeat-containing protein [Listeria ivanovii]MBM5637865.1 right-handed parallel beta-helix repeat-containing protein [Listeria ivanovii]MBM5707009.1 right-handed parallel beta-helix repeat-containing protein [Listeria ivanovii]
MTNKNYYDVTTWAVGDPYEDIGEVINSIIADIKLRQTEIDVNDGGKPGGVIYLPPGDYRLRTQVLIDISYLKILGSGHGFTSSSIRFNVPKEKWTQLHELWPGGSRILVDLPVEMGAEEQEGAAFVVKREGEPRISSVEFSNFNIDGLHFEDAGLGFENPENTYLNGKTGIYVASACDSFRITEMGLIYLEHALTIYHADALTVHDNFIAECGNCIELRGWGQASKITDNLIGAGFNGYSIFAENFGGLLVTANNVFPRGKSCLHFKGVTRSSVTNNRFHAFYPGVIIFENNCSDNLIATNHILRDQEPWEPFFDIDNGQVDTFGILCIDGSYNSIIGNHLSLVIDSAVIKPVGASPIMIRLTKGKENFVSNNHFIGTQTKLISGESAFEAQVDSLLKQEATEEIKLITVLIEENASKNTVLDSGYEEQVVMNQNTNIFRPLPKIGS